MLTHLHDIISNDVPGLSFRIWFYGSRQQGTKHAESDLDLAIEMLSPMEDGQALAHWMCFHQGWEMFLSGELGLAVQIELYRGQDFTPAVHTAIEESSEVLYESAPPPGA
jgi:predicted nucleotidyltransferase